MKFTIEAGSFIRMVQMVSERVSQSKRAKPILRVTACEGRACVQSAGRVAETEARIWEDGECTLPQARLLKRLKTYPRELDLMIEANEQGFRLGHSSMPVISYASRQLRRNSKFSSLRISGCDQPGSKRVCWRCDPLLRPRDRPDGT